MDLARVTPQSVLFPLHAEAIRSSLRDRYVGGMVRFESRHWRVLLITSGQVQLEQGDAVETLDGPALFWSPWHPDRRMKVRAGSTGALLMMDERALANAIGHKPEAAALRLLAERQVVLRPDATSDVMARIDSGFGQILQEVAQSAPGSETVIEAQVRVLLVYLWRHVALPEEQQTAPPASQLILLTFRQLLETHFRDRWAVTQYARAIGVSPDRLHSICTRALGRPPQRLIHERTGHEAQVLLRRSAQTLDQIAAHLGFKSAAQFNAFFKTLTGMPPGGYRSQSRLSGQGDGAPAIRSYADWP